jgi:thymidylate kinase
VAATTDVLLHHLRVSPIERVALAVSSYRRPLWLLCTARDRQRAYRSARKFATNGGLVLCDRYPHARLSSMEVPLIANHAGDRANGRVLSAMIDLEERYHRSIAPPELLVVLRVDPEVAVARKVDESPESVRSRGAEIWNIDWRGAGAHVIDASQPREAVARELKKLIWSAIA